MVVLASVLTMVLVGLPASARLRPDDDRHGPGSVVFLAGTIGVIANVVVGVGLAFLGWYSPLVVAALLLAVPVGSLAVPTVRRASVELLRAFPARAWVELLPAVVALLVPRSAIYFLFQTGDMGSYTNDANILADIGVLPSGFPPAFTVLLANTHVFLGESRIAVLVPTLGVLFATGVVAVARGVGSSTIAAVATGVIVALHPVSAWFAVFPVSEAVYATLVLGLLHLLVVARRTGSLGVAALAGVMCGVLLLTRANALLLLGVLGVAGVASVLVDDRVRGRVQMRFTVVGVASLLAAYVYSVREIPLYFVQNQLRGQFSPSLFATLGRWQLTGPSRPLIVVCVVTVVAVWLAGRVALSVIERRSQPWTGALGGLRFLTLAVAVYATIGFGTGGLTDALERWGVGLVVLVAAGVVLLAVRPALETDTVVVTAGLVLGLAGTVLFAKRIDFARTHAYHLYWDRYLFSEGFPVAMVIAALALTALGRVIGARAWGAAAVVAVAGAAVVPMLPRTADQFAHPFLGDPYGALAEIADDIPQGVPVYFASTPEPPRGWFFPNTYRAFALPLAQTFNVRVRDLPDDAFGPDPMPSVEELRANLVAVDAEVGFLLVARAADETLDYSGPGIELVEAVEETTWMRSRRLDPDEEEYRRIDLVLDLYRIDAGSPNSA